MGLIAHIVIRSLKATDKHARLRWVIISKYRVRVL